MSSYSPACTVVPKTKMVPLEMSQHVPWVLPSILVGVDGTEPAVGPASFITAKEHPIYLCRGATIVCAGLVSGQLTSQRFLGYPVGEDLRQESNGTLLATISATALCNHCDVRRVCCRRAVRLAVTDSRVWVACCPCATRLVPSGGRSWDMVGCPGLMGRGWAISMFGQQAGSKKVRYAHAV